MTRWGIYWIATLAFVLWAFQAHHHTLMVVALVIAALVMVVGTKDTWDRL
ncbi:hypothetical protein [Actinopolymorpha rutila]|uniref:Uncharacterized protein n=1 Tax=Actinopolymorpha rutila TaxID=446787 RepID=A0A852ZJ16_9ACTN|nr:hypothetical protein [Actinopolymorpha rutila]NYH92125.1 hypothetical protein [Actinopolymorpha rutila]